MGGGTPDISCRSLPLAPLHTQLTVNSGATWGTHKAPKLSPQAQCGANPVVDPALPYSLYALNQRCAEAQLVPLGRRLAGEGASRRLPNEGYSKDDCYRACSRQNFIEPFYFELRGNDTEAQCYWCVLHFPCLLACV